MRVGWKMTVRLLSLQVARGIAANLVVLQHLTEFELKYAGVKFPEIVRYSDLGVDVFFVLSGFIMAAIAGHKVGPLEFLWRRAARIYPTYWLATFLTLAAALAVPGLVHEPLDSIPWWRSFLLIAASPKQPIVSVGWTLVHEVYFYLVFALFLRFRIPIVLGAFVWGAALVMVALVWPDYISTSPILNMATSPLTFEFMLGLIIAVLWLRGVTPNGAILGLTSVVMLAISIALHFHFFATDLAPFGNSWHSVALRVIMFGIPISLILFALVNYEHQTLWRPPRLLVALGDWSYGTYLFHFMVLSALGRAVLGVFSTRPTIGSVVLFAVGFLMVNLGGAVVFVLFERSSVRWLNRLSWPSIRKISLVKPVPATTDPAQ
jgi:exopolysaccharide production protein ExoZ